MRLLRFTYRTRAFEEARMLGHDALGDEDLLSGVLRAGEGFGAEALLSLGVTLEDARRECEEMLSEALWSIGISLDEIRREPGEAFDMRIPDDRRIPHPPSAKRALVEARKEMRRLGDGYLGTDHILLGLLGNEDGTAVRLLSRRGISPGHLAGGGGGQVVRVARGRLGSGPRLDGAQRAEAWMTSRAAA